MRAVLLENIRSAYNVWNIIRSADAFGYDVILAGYTPSPFENWKVKKTSLWAENSVQIKSMYNPKDTLSYVKDKYNHIIAAELSDKAISLEEQKSFMSSNWIKDICIVFWNEVKWVTLETLEFVDKIVYIPMGGEKESLNVCETASIFMYMMKG